MIPVFASIVVQTVEVNVPYVRSFAFEPDSRVVIRKIDVTQTLSAVSKDKLQKTRKLTSLLEQTPPSNLIFVDEADATS